ncbi:MAG: mechanosensitive ion channel family protein [Myxococcales bacterium]|nr:mechanosensitive ion channel family protein [Myxococcales bacterium]
MLSRHTLSATLMALWLCLSPRAASSQPLSPAVARQAARSGAAAAVEAPAVHVAADSPRASMLRFRELCARGRWAEASRFLDLSPGQSEEGPRLARELSEVIAQEFGWDFAALSVEPNGDPDDGLAPRVDQVGEIATARGTLEPLRITRRETAEGARWIVVRGSVNRISGWYNRLEGRWAREHLPGWLNARGPREILWWQWAALPVLALVALVIGRIAAGLARRVLTRLLKSTLLVWDPQIVDRTIGPLTLLVAALLLQSSVAMLSLYRDAQFFVDGVLKSLLFGALFWALWRTAELLGRAVSDSHWASEHAGSVTLVPLGVKLGRVLIAAVSIVAVLSSLGYPVASLLAGLGIGGLALALAAQKTGEHLFGTVAIGFDQPFRVGDWVKIEEHEGIVEAVGLRSTRVRTLNRTVVSIPNGKLADMKTETFSARDRFRVNAVFSLEMGTRAETLRAVLEGLRAAALAHPKLHRETLWVFFKAVSASSFDVEVSAWFETRVYEEWLDIRGEMLLAFLAAIDAAGARLAYPTQTVRFDGPEGLAPREVTPRLVAGR